MDSRGGGHPTAVDGARGPGPDTAGGLRRRAAALAERALRLESALDPVRRRLAGSSWAGPVRAEFETSLAARHRELVATAAALREEADRLHRSALAAETGGPAPGLPWR